MLKKLFLGVATALLLLVAPINASAAECTLYEQSHPAFFLDGAHLSTGKCSTCASCHRGGVFTGTPKSCVACHNGDPSRVTVSRSPQHIPTSLLECSSCHNTTSFTATWSMDHTKVTAQRCDTCHDGNFLAYNAQNKGYGGAMHIITVADCGTCHTTTNWTVSHSQIHAGITTGCVSCHDNIQAIGKASYAPGHPVTSDACETCHSVDLYFKCAQAYDSMINYASVLLQKVTGFFKSVSFDSVFA